MGTSGSLQSVTLRGVTFEVRADADASLEPKAEKEALETSGSPVIKLTKKNGNITGIKLAARASEMETLEEIVNAGAVPCTLVEADGSVWTCGAAHVMAAARTTMENAVEITLLPADGVGFVRF